MTSARTYAAMAIAVLSACSAPSTSDPRPTASVHPTEAAAPGAGATGTRFGGVYIVPTVAPELSAAARFDVAEIEWTVTGTTAKLAYKLPMALVGKRVDVDFTGSIDQASQRASLVGAAGTADCTLTSATVSCHEVMRGLLPLEPDLAVVGALATDYAGPPRDRVRVAEQFGVDPIGVAIVDFARPLAHAATDERKPEKD